MQRMMRRRHLSILLLPLGEESKGLLSVGSMGVCEEFYCRVVRQLVEYDRRVINDEDEGSNMPIHLAALNGHANVVEILLELGAQVDAR